MKALLDIVRRHSAGEAAGIYSVCSAHPLVLRAAFGMPARAAAYALIEATSNQVNQEGGYTGLRPARVSRSGVRASRTRRAGARRVVLGGDHLGSERLAGARVRASAAARRGDDRGVRERGVSQDPPRLLDVLRGRPAGAVGHGGRLPHGPRCARWRRMPGDLGGERRSTWSAPKCPVPGGAPGDHPGAARHDAGGGAVPPSPRTEAFAEAGASSAWERVIGLVVQPGVEFDHDRVIDYRPDRARALSACIRRAAHGLRGALDRLPDARRIGRPGARSLRHSQGGPGLTFALREAVWALDRIEQEWRGESHSSHVRATVLGAMRADPTHWRKYYHGAGKGLELQLEYSLSDRIRYYWPVGSVVAALERLRAAFEDGTAPLALISQYLPGAYDAVRAGEIAARVPDLVVHHVRQVLARYSQACDPKTNPERSAS